ncbi:DUF4275 family protein [Mesobacillus subterraneus]|uniref:DUF4275 family protein n=1 Tax=Mesobacillus subterraneus TaxID=285983 RepID=UPI001CFF2128|nr:DUF4275 family protein [Mesobacillus subterraneus]WLR57370.1 DUF4275 family protein [Mesobacillus subterraneus]
MDFFGKLKSKRIQVSKTEDFGNDLRQKWESAFASQLSPKEKRQIFLHDKGGASGFLWHLFSYEKRKCEKEEQAELAFDNQYKDTCLIFFQHSDEVWKVKDASDLTAKDLLMTDGEYADLYIVDRDFRWTFVVTHEQGWIGPFFCRKGE